MSAVTPPNGTPNIPNLAPEIEPRDEGWFGRSVQWFREPGEYETLRRVFAVFIAILLSLTIIGIPVVILASQEWNRQEEASVERERIRELERRREHMAPTAQAILDSLPASVELLANCLTNIEEFIRTNEALIQSLGPRLEDGRFDLSSYSPEELEQLYASFQDFARSGRGIATRSEVEATGIQAEIHFLRDFSFSVPEDILERFTVLNEQFNLLKQRVEQLKSTTLEGATQIQNRRTEASLADIDRRSQQRREQIMREAEASLADIERRSQQRRSQQNLQIRERPTPIALSPEEQAAHDEQIATLARADMQERQQSLLQRLAEQLRLREAESHYLSRPWVMTESADGHGFTLEIT